MGGVESNDRWVWRGFVAAVGGVGVVVVADIDLLAGALRAGALTTVDARIVEVRVKGPKVAAAAVPQSCHADVGEWLTGGIGRWNGWQSSWSWNADED